MPVHTRMDECVRKQAVLDDVALDIRQRAARHEWMTQLHELQRCLPDAIWLRYAAFHVLGPSASVRRYLSLSAISTERLGYRSICQW